MASTANWLNVSLDDLSVTARREYEEYKTSYRIMKENRERFEGTMAKDNPVATGQRLVFGYNFGKLSLAVVADDQPRKQAKPKQSLADFLANQR